MRALAPAAIALFLESPSVSPKRIITMAPQLSCAQGPSRDGTDAPPRPTGSLAKPAVQSDARIAGLLLPWLINLWG